MSRTRSFLIGATLGASAMFFSLQFHILRTDSGFKVLPRTPQQSLGLTYSDIRGWPADRWQDRPELARAILANGSGELIADSVAGSLRDALAENTATLDELRGFLDRTRPRNSTRNSENTFVRTQKPVVETTPDPNERPIPFTAVTPRPLPGGKTPADPFRKAQPQENSSRFSDTDVQQGLTGTARPTRPQAAPATPARPENPSESPAAALIRQQAEDIEKRIFGDSKSDTPATPRSGLPPQTSTLPVFEEVTASLEEQAHSLLEEARQLRVASAAPADPDATTVQPAAAAASALQKVAENAAAALTEFVRSPAPSAAETTPFTTAEAAADQTSASPVTGPGAETLPPAGFDPFLE
ncbi:MAG: hypothetical protein ACK57O_13150 [Planctomyces sp.]